MRTSRASSTVSASVADQTLRASGTGGADDLADVIPSCAIPYVEVAISSNDIGVVDDIVDGGQITNSGNLTFKCNRCTLRTLRTCRASRPLCSGWTCYALLAGRADDVGCCTSGASITGCTRRPCWASNTVKPGITLRTGWAYLTLNTLRASVTLHTLHTMWASGAERALHR